MIVDNVEEVTNISVRKGVEDTDSIVQKCVNHLIENIENENGTDSTLSTNRIDGTSIQDRESKTNASENIKHEDESNEISFSRYKEDANTFNEEHANNLTEKSDTLNVVCFPSTASSSKCGSAEVSGVKRIHGNKSNNDDSSRTTSSTDLWLKQFSSSQHLFQSKSQLDNLGVNNEQKYKDDDVGQRCTHVDSCMIERTSSEFSPCPSCDVIDPLELAESIGCCGMCKTGKDLSRISEFWLISVPKTDTVLGDLNSETEKNKLCQIYKFHIPILKVGTLNVLLSMTEQLSTLDAYVLEIVVKLCGYLQTGLEDEFHIYDENLRVNNLNPVTYLTRFSWNKSKYPTWNPIPLTADIIYKSMEKIDKSFKRKLNILDNMASSLGNYERRESDSLQFRYLGDIVKKEHFVLNSRYLKTLLVVVPNHKISHWFKCYEHLCDMAVPQSSTKLYDNGKQSLFNVTIYKKCMEQFIVNARKKMFIVRDYEYSESQITEQAYYERLSRIKTRQLAILFRWTIIQFGECFEAWIHVKALRVFVESVLRFGLPINYEAILILPLKSKRKLKSLLNKLFSHVDNRLATGAIDEIPGGLTIYGVDEYYPYVYFEIKLDFLVFKK